MDNGLPLIPSFCWSVGVPRSPMRRVSVPPHVLLLPRVLVPQHILPCKRVGTPAFLSLYVSIDRLSASSSFHNIIPGRILIQSQPYPLSQALPFRRPPRAPRQCPTERPRAPRYFKIVHLLSHIPASEPKSLFLLSESNHLYLTRLPSSSLNASLHNGRSTAPNPAMQV